MKPCPFCGEMPAITEHAPKIYGRYHALTMHSIDTKETAIKSWNYRSDEKEATK